MHPIIKTNIVLEQLKNLACKFFISRRTKINVYCVLNKIKICHRGEKSTLKHHMVQLQTEKGPCNWQVSEKHHSTFNVTNEELQNPKLGL